MRIVQDVRERVGTVLGRPRRWRWLESLPKGGVGAEIGVFRGRLSPHLHDTGKPSELHLIDCWWTRWGERYPDWAEMTDFGRLRTRDAYDEAVRRMRGRRCEFHVGDDIEILSSFPDRHFDWVYLDSDHSYEHVRDVLPVLAPKLKPSGVIVGDDWKDDPADPNHGESVAVREFCEHHDWRVDWIDRTFDQWQISATPDGQRRST